MITALGPDFVGNTCPDGHMCKIHVYSKTAWCDGCECEIAPGTEGERCKHCCYDLCLQCKDFRPLPSQDLTSPLPAPAQSTPNPTLFPQPWLGFNPSYLPPELQQVLQTSQVAKAPKRTGNRMKLKHASSCPGLQQRPTFVTAFDGCVVPVIELWTWSM